jgi:hypothetical protein
LSAQSTLTIGEAWKALVPAITAPLASTDLGPDVRSAELTACSSMLDTAAALFASAASSHSSDHQLRNRVTHYRGKALDTAVTV